MLVSVIMLTYNHEKFISKAIEGVLAQKTNFLFELIIANDHSTDRTEEIIKKYRNNNRETVKGYFNHKNIGPKKNFIKAYEVTKGKYVAMCEGDDFWTDPNKLQKQVDFLENNSEYSICFHNVEILDDRGAKVERDRLFDKEKRDYHKNELLFGKYLPTPSLLFRRYDLSNYYSIFSKVFNGDTLLLSILTQLGAAKYIDEISPSVIIKHNNGIWSSKQDLEKWENNLNTYFQIYKILNPKLKEEYFIFFKKSYGFAIHKSITDNNKRYKLKFLLKYILFLLRNKKFGPSLFLIRNFNNKEIINYFII